MKKEKKKNKQKNKQKRCSLYFYILLVYLNSISVPVGQIYKVAILLFRLFCHYFYFFPSGFVDPQFTFSDQPHRAGVKVIPSKWKEY